jgi:release factor glutamine methyltransferase
MKMRRKSRILAIFVVMISIRDIRKEMTESLTGAVGPREAAAMVKVIFEDALGYSAVDLALKGDNALQDDTAERLRAIVSRVVDGEPLQYVLGRARFRGLMFRVTPDVLIPRPETAQLVDMIADRYEGRRDLRVLDIGTGSGCIACSLARALPFADVTAVDISDAALAVARDNARRHGVSVNFVHADALTMTATADSYDIIVSNPPYIAAREAVLIEHRVLDHEPHSALFVPDDDPLLFYRHISRYAIDALSAGGRLYLEINPLFVDQLRAMTRTQPWREVTIVRDFCGKERFTECQL